MYRIRKYQWLRRLNVQFIKNLSRVYSNSPGFLQFLFMAVHVINSVTIAFSLSCFPHSIYWPLQGRMGKKKKRRIRQNRENWKNCRTQKVLSPGLLDSPLVMFIDQGDSNLGPLPIVQLTTNNVMEIITHIFEKIANYSNIFTDSSVLENVNMYI